MAMRHLGSLSNNYMDALRKYWNGANSESLKIVTKALCDESCEDKHHFYRLWIELLVENDDVEAMALLGHHLELISKVEVEDVDTYMALRGQIHLEIDEFEAAHLIARVLAKKSSNPFIAEFMQTFQLRTGESFKSMYANVESVDYFHLKGRAVSFMRSGDKASCAEAINSVANFYPEAPLSDEFEMHKQFDAGDFVGATKSSKELVNRFPENFEFAFAHAFALYKAERFEDAKKILTSWEYRFDDHDADAHSLLGHVYYRCSELEKAKRHLTRAASVKKDLGLPVHHDQNVLNQIEEGLRGEELDPAVSMPRHTRMWLAKLDTNEYFDLRSKDESEIQFVDRPLGDAPKNGDFCFLAFEQRTSDANVVQWKIGAIYAVNTDPQWDPKFKNVSSLQLVHRPPVAIPVEVNVLDEDEEELFHDKHPFNFGVYELEDGALDIITEAVKQRHGLDLEVEMKSDKVG